jgi:hypothetical protein
VILILAHFLLGRWHYHVWVLWECNSRVVSPLTDYQDQRGIQTAKEVIEKCADLSKSEGTVPQNFSSLK